MHNTTIFKVLFFMLLTQHAPAQEYRWERVGTIDSCYSIASNGTLLYAGRDRCILVSENDGLDWKPFYCFPIFHWKDGGHDYVYGDLPFSLEAYDSVLYVGSVGGEMLMPENGGGLRLFKPGIIDSAIGMQSNTISSISRSGDILVCSVYTDYPMGTFICTTTGHDWKQVGPSNFGSASCFYGALIVSSDYDSIRITQDTGLTWTAYDIPQYKRAVRSYNNALFFSLQSSTDTDSSTNGIFYSIDTGRTLKYAGLKKIASAFTEHRNHLYAVCADGVYRTINSSTVVNPVDSLASIKLSPQPVRAIVTVSWSAKNRCTKLEVYDSQSRLILQHDVDRFLIGTQIDLKDVAAGLYAMRISFADGSSSTHCIVKIEE